MELKEKLNLIEEALEMDEGSLSPEMEVSSIEEWDSISFLSIIVMLKDNFGKKLTSNDAKSIKTIQDILEHMQ